MVSDSLTKSEVMQYTCSDPGVMPGNNEGLNSWRQLSSGLTSHYSHYYTQPTLLKSRNLIKSTMNRNFIVTGGARGIGRAVCE